MIRKTLYVIGLLGALTNTARAQESAAISSARETAKSGIEDYFAGRYDTAQHKLASAFEVVRVPTLALFNARALSKLGKLVEASEFYLTAMRLKSNEGDTETQEQARRDAKQERADLLKRIPRLRIEVIGARPDQVLVQANGTRVAPSLFATGWMVNPGSVRVTGKLGDQQREAVEQFAETETKIVQLRFSPAAEVARPLAIHPSVAEPPGEQRPPSHAYYNTAGWVGVGVATAGLALGTVTGLWAISERAKLDTDESCRDTKCNGAKVGDQVDQYNTLRHVSTAGFIVSAVGAAASVVLFVQDARQQRATQRAQVKAWVGVGSVGVGGAF